MMSHLRDPESGPDGVPHQVENLSIPGLLASLTLAFIVAAIGEGIAELAGYPQYGILWEICGCLLPR